MTNAGTVTALADRRARPASASAPEQPFRRSQRGGSVSAQAGGALLGSRDGAPDRQRRDRERDHQQRQHPALPAPATAAPRRDRRQFGDAQAGPEQRLDRGRSTPPSSATSPPRSTSARQHERRHRPPGRASAGPPAPSHCRQHPVRHRQRHARRPGRQPFGKVDFGGGSDVLSLGGGAVFHGSLLNTAALGGHARAPDRRSTPEPRRRQSRIAHRRQRLDARRHDRQDGHTSTTSLAPRPSVTDSKSSSPSTASAPRPGPTRSSTPARSPAPRTSPARSSPCRSCSTAS